jgi:hypothetical protein
MRECCIDAFILPASPPEITIIHATCRTGKFAVAFLALVALAGCGGPYPNVARVSGKVTLGGQPLADAVLIFSPLEAGSPSSGRTDSQGNYTLIYTRRVNGAEIGEHSVTISTGREADPDADPPTPAVPEKVPYKYRLPGALKATVVKGSNTINFDLEPGPVEEPQPAKGKARKK